MIGPAIKYWFLAAQRDAARSTHIEALHHFDKALHLLAHVPQDSARNALELDLLIVRGRTIISLRGGGADEIERNYRRANELSQGHRESLQHFFAIWGLWIFHLVRGELATANLLAEDLFSLTHLHQNQELLVRAHSCIGWTSFFLGRFDEAKTHLLATISLHNSHKISFTQDAGISAKTILARTLWIVGEVDQVEALAHEALEMARKLGHPFTLAFTLTAASSIYVTLRNAHRALSFAEEAIAVATKYSFEGPLAWAASFQGWALFEMGNEEGLTRLQKGVAAAREAKAGLDNTHTLALLADVYLRKQCIAEGLGVTEEALVLVHSQGEVCWQAELLRLKGELFLAQSDQSAGAAEQCFLEAIAIAQAQQATMLELRATTSLARLWQQQNKSDLAKQVLGLIRSKFGESCDNLDVLDAQALLDQFGVVS